jgi:O-antigen ligase
MKLHTKVALWLGGVLLMLLFLRRYLFYFSTPIYLQGLILIEIVVATLWRFEVVFFPFLMLVFLWAGSDPGLLAGVAGSVRWVVLGIGAPAGAFLWMRRRQRAFTALHLAALFCVGSALASAMMSNVPMISLLKVASLFLLFLYASTGARMAIVGREERFMRGLLLASEVVVFSCALGAILGLSLMGNPNSLGAVMAVGLTPLLLWGFVVAQTPAERYRRGAVLLLCGVLLYSSLSRASLLAATVSAIVFCVCLRRQRLLLRGAFLCVFFLSVAAVARPEQFSDFVSATTENVVYKGKREQGLLGSRKNPWEEGIALVKEHPWFGTGFGTSDVGEVADGSTSLDVMGGLYTGAGALREHGNSYLAIMEYMGLFGVIPFVFLLFLVVRMIVQMCLWMRRTTNVYHPGIPMAMVLMAGLVHAFFEDWLFAVGYHLCVFFWIMAFLLKDLLPSSDEVEVSYPSRAYSPILRPAAGPLVVNR